MHERRLIGDLGFRIDVFMASPPQWWWEKLLRRPHLERVSVIGGMMSKEEARERRTILADGAGSEKIVYKVVKEVPPDFSI
jgi:hypothetical protein